VNALDQNDESCADVARHLDGRPDVAVHSRQVVVVAQRRGVGELAESLSHCDVVPGPLRSEMLVERVTQATPPLMEDASTQVLPGIGK
jgi:hypothetical protein